MNLCMNNIHNKYLCLVLRIFVIKLQKNIPYIPFKTTNKKYLTK